MIDLSTNGTCCYLYRRREEDYGICHVFKSGRSFGLLFDVLRNTPCFEDEIVSKSSLVLWMKQESFVRRLGYWYSSTATAAVLRTAACVPFDSSTCVFYCLWKQLERFVPDSRRESQRKKGVGSQNWQKQSRYCKKAGYSYPPVAFRRY